MTETVKLKSPIDGSIYAERPVATDQAVNAAVERAKAAQAAWAETPIAERGKYLLAFLDALSDIDVRAPLHRCHERGMVAGPLLMVSTAMVLSRFGKSLTGGHRLPLPHTGPEKFAGPRPARFP